MKQSNLIVPSCFGMRDCFICPDHGILNPHVVLEWSFPWLCTVHILSLCARAYSPKHIVQAHVKAVEKGHPLAALGAATSKPASPLLFSTAHPSMFQPFSGTLGGFAHGMPPGVEPGGGPNWGGLDGMGKNAPDKIRVYSPSGSRGLDSIGQALSAALKVCCFCFMARHLSC